MVRCNCESSFCKHHNHEPIRKWPYTDSGCDPCSNDAKDSPYTMDYVGKVCTPCAESVIANDGEKYIHRNTSGVGWPD